MIRRLRNSDLQSVLAIERESFGQPWSEVLFQTELNNPESINLALDEGGKLLGYLCAGCVLDEMDIRVIAVDPEARRRGYGRRLVQALLDIARRQGTVFVHLEVRESNEAAKRLYQSLGFRPVGRRKAYYAQPVEDALLYTAELR